MPRLYGNVDKVYVKSKGYQPVTITGSGYGQLLMERAKSMGKKFIPQAKNVYDSLSQTAKEELFKLGISESDVKQLGAEAQQKLQALLKKERSDGKISKSAQKLLKKLVGTTKANKIKKIASKAKKPILKNASKLKALLSKLK